eukprot:CAMPEP_0114590568 /NCGR_PEP_ID=MMETSP0125-20121206/12797_1 /TAXON_ID=485358 ORGANISM="Aristerostoma sp., Strain ATCC 50986" /NCGR_SAMPLE_ID=MMETSP0125 /ASSEMBLY_ACC=CAM_ASM_000245 /LENGTH=98 /DNA_ID=CAMNT_0001788147 /DNA_START=414 /DNA_END=710 /DNA_ORIENTATION=-
MSFLEAFQLVRQKRPIICPNPGFQTQLKRFEVFLQKNNHDLSKHAGRKKAIGTKSIYDTLSKPLISLPRVPRVTYSKPLGLKKYSPYPTYTMIGKGYK